MAIRMSLLEYPSVLRTECCFSTGRFRVCWKRKIKTRFCYLDNVTVARRTQNEHDANVKFFLEAIHCNNFILDESSTVSSDNSIKILG